MLYAEFGYKDKPVPVRQETRKRPIRKRILSLIKNIKANLRIEGAKQTKNKISKNVITNNNVNKTTKLHESSKYPKNVWILPRCQKYLSNSLVFKSMSF